MTTENDLREDEAFDRKAPAKREAAPSNDKLIERITNKHKIGLEGAKKIQCLENALRELAAEKEGKT